MTEQRLAYLRIFGKGIVSVVILCMKRLVRKKSALEESHFVLAVERRNSSAPEIPHEVAGVLLLRAAAEICLIRKLAQLVKQSLARVLHALYADALEPALIVHRYTAVKQQIIVAGLVHSALCVYETDMPLQLFAVAE